MEKVRRLVPEPDDSRVPPLDVARMQAAAPPPRHAGRIGRCGGPGPHAVGGNGALSLRNRDVVAAVLDDREPPAKGNEDMSRAASGDASSTRGGNRGRRFDHGVEEHTHETHDPGTSSGRSAPRQASSAGPRGWRRAPCPHLVLNLHYW